MTVEALLFVAGLIVGGLIVGTIVGIWVYRVAMIGAEEWVQDHVDEDSAGLRRDDQVTKAAHRLIQSGCADCRESASGVCTMHNGVAAPTTGP